jgi:hypothetical protein
MVARDGNKILFFTGVFFVSCSMLSFQILQTRILSVIAWYYLAFFAISVAMLGMTVGAVWIYTSPEQFQSTDFIRNLRKFSFFAALSIPASMVVQFSLVTVVTPSFVTLVAWALLLATMAAP